MDLLKYLKSVTKLNEYITFTCDLQNMRIKFKVPFNISTILALKEIRCLEIEYFNKCDENGAAITIFELLVRSPPSKSWSLLGRDLVSLLQYWMEAIRKHLIIHNVHWWTFLNRILKFINEIHSKDASLNKLLIEETSEYLLDLATQSVPDVKQRLDIIQIFNLISADSSRNIRMAYKEKFQKYFIKLSALLASCGDCPLQYRILEALLRWLLPRHDMAVRRAVAAKWFPEGTYTRAAVHVFLQRPWQNFMLDARAFLNAQNDSGDLVTSVVCEKISVGQRECFPGKNKVCWLDVNSSTKSISVLLDPALGSALGGADNGHDVLIISDENTSKVDLKRESQHVLVTAIVLTLSHVYPFSSDIIEGSSSSTISMTVSSRSDLRRLHRALSGAFDAKYQNTVDVEEIGICGSPHDEGSNSDVINSTEEDLRFSMPLEIRRRKHLGFMVRKRETASLNSPSTISTSSLAQLHEKLAALPRYTFDKEPVSVCALPQLSTVSEVSETEENRSRNSSLTTVRHRTYGVSQKKCNRASNISNEISKRSPEQNDNENSVSCLLMATIGSADESIISDLIERLPENTPCNTDNIVDLLAKEALQDNLVRKSDINATDENNKNKKSVETLLENQFPNNLLPTDESSNEVVENTPLNCVQFRTPERRKPKHNLKSNIELTEKRDDINLTHDVEAVENFFSQHFAENRNGDLIISPTLARKINQTSSECSDDVDLYIAPSKNIVDDIKLAQLSLPNVDIVECVNEMVDKVCQDLEKCAKYMDSINELKEVKDNTITKRTLKKKCITKSSTKEHENLRNNAPKQVKSNKPITLKKIKQHIKKQPITIMSPIMERDSKSDDTVTKNLESLVDSPKCSKTRLMLRKRKLYSPKDETCHLKSNALVIEATEDDSISNSELKAYSRTPKSNATCYKELEQERKKRIRRPRTRLLKKREILTSPRTLKNNQIFDSLKYMDNGEPIKLADKTSLSKDLAVYNITSDSEDEHVNKKVKNNTIISENISNKVADNAKTMIKTSRSRKKAALKTIQVTDEKKVEDVKCSRNRRTKKTISKNEKENELKVEYSKRHLEDELVRHSHPNESDILNTSLFIDCLKDPEKSVNKEPAPALNVVHRMECILEDNVKSDENDPKNNELINIPKRILSLKRNKKPSSNADLDIDMADNERTISPLPGLVVETVLKTDLDVNDSVSVNMLQMFKDIYEGKKPVPESEVNTTLNLLSDTNEPFHYSPSSLNVAEELNRADDEKPSEALEEVTKKIVKKKKIKKSTDKNKSSKIKLQRKFETVKSQVHEKIDIVRSSVPKVNSERTMATMATSNSPITGHGNFDEDPPNSAMLNERIEPRMIEQENLNQTLKDFFCKLTEQVDQTNRNDSASSENDFENVEKTPSDCSSVKSNTNVSPVVLITRLSPEYVNQMSNNSDSFDNIKLKSHKTIASSKESSKENLRNRLDAGSSTEKIDKTPKTEFKKTRRSVISPIKLFDDMNFKNTKTSSYALSEGDDDCLKHVKTKFSSKKQTAHTNSRQIEAMESRSPRAGRRTVATSSPISRTECTSTERRKAESNSSTASGISKTSKRNSPPVLRSSKRMKLDDVNNNFGAPLVDSGPSMSSINEWFTKNVPTRKEDSVKYTIKDYMNNVLEKLDTTLVEIHHNTSRRLIDMFVASAGQLEELRRRRERLYRETATEVLTSVVRTMETKFVQLNDSLQSMDDEFMENLKKQAHDLIHDESKQKRLMVNLLREDVQTVQDHLARGKMAD